MEGDLDALAAELLKLKDPKHRATLGRAVAKRMAEEYSWVRHAEIRLADYRSAID